MNSYDLTVHIKPGKNSKKNKKIAALMAHVCHAAGDDDATKRPGPPQARHVPPVTKPKAKSERKSKTAKKKDGFITTRQAIQAYQKIFSTAEYEAARQRIRRAEQEGKFFAKGTRYAHRIEASSYYAWLVNL